MTAAEAGMSKRRCGSCRERLAELERRAAQSAGPGRPRVVVWLPRKDGDDRPLGVISRSGNALTVLYDPDRPDPPLPEGW